MAGQKLIESPVVKSKSFNVAIQQAYHTLADQTTHLECVGYRAELILDGPEQVPPAQVLWVWSRIAESGLRVLDCQ